MIEIFRFLQAEPLELTKSQRMPVCYPSIERPCANVLIFMGELLRQVRSTEWGTLIEKFLLDIEINRNVPLFNLLWGRFDSLEN